ncbi:MAG: AMP-binding protein, partial [Alphaproteobacteria bacterium]|nr:AMP-binding protein [Alphaproteobacteria bacterium]
MKLDDVQVLADVPRFHAKQTPDRAAMIFEGRTTSYAQLDERTNRVANALIEAGVRPQQRIGYLGKNSDLYFELFF